MKTHLLTLAILASACSPSRAPASDRGARPPGSLPSSDTSPQPARVNLDSALRAGPVPALVDTALTTTIATAPYALQIPSQATVDTGGIHPRDIRGLRVRGPVIPARGYRDVAYELVVATYPNASRLPLARWVDSLRRATNQFVDEPDSLDYITPASLVHLGSEDGLLVDFFCGDCQPWAIYVARDTFVVALAFTAEQTRALSYDEQIWMAMHIGDSFRWR